MRRVRFPFTFMGWVSLFFGGWIFFYLAFHPPYGPVTAGIEVMIAFAMVAFGSGVLWRRYRHGDFR